MTETLSRKVNLNYKKLCNAKDSIFKVYMSINSLKKRTESKESLDVLTELESQLSMSNNLLKHTEKTFSKALEYTNRDDVDNKNFIKQ